MRTYDENIVLEARKKRWASLPEETQRKLEEFGKTREFTNDLLLIKRKRPKLEKGDVFVVQPKEGLYFYGRVLNAHVDVQFHNSTNYKWKDSLVVCVYRNRTARLTLDDFKPEYANLLVPPSYIISAAFYSGYLYKLGNVPFTQEEENLKYGFFSISFRVMTNDYGHAIDYMPDIIGVAAIGNYGSLAFQLQNEFIIDPSLLDTTDMPKPSVQDEPFDEHDEEEAELSESELIAMRTHTLHLNARLMPFDRGDLFEDPINAALKEQGLGEVVGGGTSMLKTTREPQSSDIDIELVDNTPESIHKLGELLSTYLLPKGSVLYLSEQDTLSLGSLEGLALYFNNTALPKDLMEQYDLNDIAKELGELMALYGKRWSYWNAPTTTALYFYGESFQNMKAAISPYLKSHPRCQMCLIEQIA